MAIVIRKLNLFKKESQDVLQHLDTTILPADEPYPKKGSQWWVVYDDGVAVAFSGLKLWNSTTAFLCRAGVLRSHQGKGLHRKMLKVREAYAKKVGITLLVTYVAKHNMKSANNLIKSKYVLYSPTQPWGTEDALYFRKAL